MSTVISISTARRYGVARVCRVWGLARTGIYRGRRAAMAPPADDDLITKLEAANQAVAAAKRAADAAGCLVYSGKGAEHAARLAHCARMKSELAAARADVAAIRADLSAVGLSAHERIRLRAIVVCGVEREA